MSRAIGLSGVRFVLDVGGQRHPHTRPSSARVAITTDADYDTDRNTRGGSRSSHRRRSSALALVGGERQGAPFSSADVSAEYAQLLI
jgi:hypothetical protein